MSGGLWGLPAAPGTQGAPALPSSARDTPAPSRPFTGVSNVAALALLIHGGLHPPKTPLLPWGCGILGWAGEGSLCPAASGRGELQPRHRSPGTLGQGSGAPSRDQTSVEAQGVQLCPCMSVRGHMCVLGLGHMCCTRGAGVPARAHPHPTRGPLPDPALGHFLLRQNRWFFLLINLTHNLMLGSDFPLPHPGDGLTPQLPDFCETPNKWYRSVCVGVRLGQGGAAPCELPGRVGGRAMSSVTGGLRAGALGQRGLAAACGGPRLGRGTSWSTGEMALEGERGAWGDPAHLCLARGATPCSNPMAPA